MKCSKGAGNIAGMLKAAGVEGVELARQLTMAVFMCGVIPSDWVESLIGNLYNSKGEALELWNGF